MADLDGLSTVERLIVRLGRVERRLEALEAKAPEEWSAKGEYLGMSERDVRQLRQARLLH